MLVMPMAFIPIVSLKILIEVVFARNDVDFLLMTSFSPLLHLNILDPLKTRTWVY